ncbi:FAD-binding protein [Leucobacter insecticola]|uniref:D-lactate dehydrogenase (cytochrome) n=1 Tax=Leucobacter insecticola TaxID=2714934 RepID=A0A6G8FK49_9MICO|nr:FAD-linked oxidase C-terminal domain-containing protein [Leucobacter insecticola]QIM16745.1 FAD-binding protein [Leucobacter insecticola]
MSTQVMTDLVDELTEALPGQVETDFDAVAGSSHDRSHHGWAPALAVVRCTTTEDVSTTLRLCHAAAMPVVTRGTGTGLEGGANAVTGSEEADRSRSIILDLSGMRRIINIDPDSLDAVVEAGVRRSELNPLLAEHGLQFVAGPGVDASIGGMAATRASGTNAVKYGTMSDNVLGLTAVLADGTVVRTGSRARKSSAGYDLTHLLIGSEGTLGVITELILRVHSIPASRYLAVLSFPSVDAAARVVQTALQTGIGLARAELLDDVQIGAMNAYSGLDFHVTPTLFIELSGSASEVTEQTRLLRAIAESNGCLDERHIDGDDPERFWKVRHDALPAANALRPNSYTWSTDVCVPISHLARCITETQADVVASGLVAPIAGHVGDGNFHLAIVLEHGNETERLAAEQLYERLITRALACGGTCTGEHGIGQGKVGDLLREHPSGVPVMRSIKQALDPAGILNPGKVLG